MRILQLVAQTRVGGAENFGFVLGSALARRGHDVLLLANRDNGPLLDRPLPPGMQARALRRSSRLDPRILSFLWGAIREHRPEIIHAHNFQPAAWARALRWVSSGSRTVVHVHGSRFVEAHDTEQVAGDRRLLASADAVIGLNDLQMEFLRDHVGIDPKKLHLVRNGIDVDAFRAPLETSRDPLRVVCVASLTDVKNHAALLGAWVTVASAVPEARLALVGDGPLRASLEAAARAGGVADSVEFVGAVSDVRPELWRSSVFVLSSYSEALPLSLLEAMAAGLACVAPAVGGIPDALREPGTGIAVPASDPARFVDELAVALIALLRDRDAAERIGRQASSTVATRFGLDGCVDQIEAIYARILEGRPPKSVPASRSPDRGTSPHQPITSRDRTARTGERS